MSLRSALSALAICTLAVVGCTVAPDQPDTTPRESAPKVVKDGLTVLKAAETTLSAAFKRDNIVIYFEAVRGKPTPAVYQKDPKFPRYEMDARFMSDDGHYFWVQRGGDDFVDPTWAEDFARAETLPEPKVSNRILFEMAAEATQQLPAAVAAQVGAARVETLAPELGTLTKMGANVLPTYIAHRAQVLDMAAAKGRELAPEIPYGTGGPESASIFLAQQYYYMDVYNQTIYMVGKHSATRTYGWNGSSWANIWDMCNHGDCPGSMSYVCRTTGSYLFKTNGWYLHTCRTGYDWDSNSGHNCHDDTRVQEAAFAQNRANNGWQQWCNNGDHGSDISAWPGDNSGNPNCSATDYSKGYGY